MRPSGTPQTLPPIDAYGDLGFRISGTRYEGDQLITEAGASPWERTYDTLSLIDFSAIVNGEAKPDTLVLGVGERLKHPARDIRQAFKAAGIGLEVLDTATACRTYNLLAGEGRRVYAALIAI